MKYMNADMILPEELLKEVQKYVNGGMIYVPKCEGTRKGWGENTGGRRLIQLRNVDIRQQFAQGATIPQLMERYYLSCDSIKKIVYTKPK
ncbi:CD3324 family protein [Paenibacillus kobensis]|uniref:CD3324 family protein n=1 Tax=Paenibacillus kobensis TaxID=59841 RepID=UPI000FDC4A97|nr:CD3324 family protein [Paenibacillus kobensis]